MAAAIALVVALWSLLLCLRALRQGIRRRSYRRKLRDPRWLAMAEFVKIRHRHTCQWCGTTRGTMDTHHIIYLNAEPWDEIYWRMGLLATLCRRCHWDPKVVRALRQEAMRAA